MPASVRNGGYVTESCRQVIKSVARGGSLAETSPAPFPCYMYSMRYMYLVTGGSLQEGERGRRGEGEKRRVRGSWRRGNDDMSDLVKS